MAGGLGIDSRLGASIWGFYHGTPPEQHPSLGEAVRTILEIDDQLGVEVWASKFLDSPVAEAEELEGLVAACAEAAFTTVHTRGAYWNWSPTNLRDEIDFAAHVGAETLVLHPECLGLTDPEDRIDAPEIRRIAAYAAERRVRLAVENMRDSVWLLDRVIDEFGDNPEKSNLGICIDIGHAHVSHDAGGRREVVSNYLERYASQLVHLHLHGNHGERDDHLLPGQGTVDWALVFEALDRIAFAGTAVIESRPAELAPREGYEQALAFFRQHVS